MFEQVLYLSWKRRGQSATELQLALPTKSGIAEVTATSVRGVRHARKSVGECFFVTHVSTSFIAKFRRSCISHDCSKKKSISQTFYFFLYSPQNFVSKCISRFGIPGRRSCKWTVTNCSQFGTCARDTTDCSEFNTHYNK